MEDPMPGVFEFRSYFTTDNLISQTTLSTGAGNGIDDPTLFSSIGSSYLFDPNQFAAVPITLHAGQTFSADVDYGSSNNVDTVNTAMWVLDASGNIVASNNNSGPDSGSIGNADPKLQFTAATVGTYI
ncbi:MAG: hypothetical protein KDE63_13075, partial [Novosphingobium sp.]|nr:hypothetical protein [Novosphingobium sp.]